MSKVRGIRGATTANSNEKDEVFNATSELLAEIVKANEIDDDDDIAAAFFTTTPDLNADFPAAAARLMGWTHVALMDAVEIDVPGSQSRCIRTLILVNTEKRADEIVNIYLREAANLRKWRVED
ncbi:MAG: chorismate mutase [Chloroflexi bacterium]|nr:chorismate mutase [Chloroflexota bacterium]